MAKPPGPERACHCPSRSDGKLQAYNYKQPQHPPFNIQEAWLAARGVLPTPHLNRHSAWDPSFLPGVDFLNAKSSAANKFVTVAEVVLTRVGESDQKQW